MQAAVRGVRCEVVRWVSDEPQPGWVEARLVDASGRQWTFFDKPPLFDAGDDLTPDTDYPVEAVMACTVVDVGVGADGQQLVTISTSSPWRLESQEGRDEFQVTQDQLVDV
jgi:hypothetical protein